MLVLCFFASCTKAPPPEASAAEAPIPAVYPANLFAVLKTGESPLWFELGEAGPRLISGPEQAELSPFTPWPLARHIRGILAREDELVLGVNREGLLLLRPWEGTGDEARGLGLYRIADSSDWENYTLGSLFFYREKAAALLYRDDRFADLRAPSPSPAVRALKDDLTGFEGLEIPTLGIISAAEDWEADALRLGNDGLWYYRGIHRRPEGQDIRYYRTTDLGRAGEEVSVGAFRSSAQVEMRSAAPPLLRQVLEKAANLGGAGISALSPDFAGPRNFAAGSSAAAYGTEENGALLFGFYREAEADPITGATVGAIAGPTALAVFPDGRGIRAAGQGGIQTFSLPPLPEDFVYTGIGLVGNTILAAWEEQREWNIGAAGFMVIDFFNQSF